MDWIAARGDTVVRVAEGYWRGETCEDTTLLCIQGALGLLPHAIFIPSLSAMYDRLVMKMTCTNSESSHAIAYNLLSHWYPISSPARSQHRFRLVDSPVGFEKAPCEQSISVVADKIMRRTTNAAYLTDRPAEPSFGQYEHPTDFLLNPAKIRLEVLYLVVHVNTFHFFVRKCNCAVR